MDSALHSTKRLGLFCEEKVVLVANYSSAVIAYGDAVAQLENGMIRESKETYAERRRLVEAARSICEAALKELDGHVTAHGC